MDGRLDFLFNNDYTPGMSTTKESKDGAIDVRSLVQLKSLSTIKDVEEQLRVAFTLCNHAHRSDMILRWLLSNLSNPTYSVRSNSWRLFTQCIRLLQPALLSSRLKGSNILAIIAKALAESEADARSDLLIALEHAIDTLLTINQQLVSASVEVAAEFLAAWSRSLWHCQRNAFQSTSKLFSTAHQVWNLRRSSDDAYFVDLCLLPAALLLSTLKTDGRATSKRHHSGRQSTADTVLQLERLISKHVFLKSRAAFFKHQHQEAPGEATELLRLQLQKLDAQLKALPDHGSSHDIFPALLNVAIRCGSISKQRQQVAEVSWYDAVFKELSQQLVSLYEPATVRKTFQEMLVVVKERSTLSLAGLQKVIEQHAMLQGETPNLDVVKTVISMNPRVFTDKASFDILAKAIERAHVEELPAIKALIVVPIVSSFIQDRRLVDFLLYWQQRIEESIDNSGQIWFELDDVLETRLEANLTTLQIKEAVKLRSEALRDPRSAGSGAERPPRSLAAVCTVLAALLRGIHSSEAEEAVLEDAHGAYSALQDIAGQDAYGLINGFWLLALRLIELCAPRWISGKDTAISHTPGTVVEGKLVLHALQNVRRRQSAKTGHQAASFIGRVCTLFKDDATTHKAVHKLLKKCAASGQERLPAMLIQYPTLFSLLDRDDYSQIKQVASTMAMHAPYVTALRESALSVEPNLERPAGKDKLWTSSTSHEEATIQLLQSMNKHENVVELAKALLSSLGKQIGSDTARWPSIIQVMLELEQTHKDKLLLSFSDIDKLCQQLPRLELDNTSFYQALVLNSLATRKAVKTQINASGTKIVTKQLASRIAALAGHLSLETAVQTTLATLTSLGAMTRAILDIDSDVLEHEAIRSECQRALSIILELIDAIHNKTSVAGQSSTYLMLSAAVKTSKELLAASHVLAIGADELSRLQQLAALVMTETTPAASPDGPAETLATHTHPAVCAYEVLCLQSAPDAVLLAHSACRLMAAPFSYSDKTLVKRAYGNLSASLHTTSRLLVIQSLLAKDEDSISFSDLIILQATIETQPKSTLQSEELMAMTGSLIQITSIARHKRASIAQAALHCTSRLLQNSSYLINQYAIDEALHTVQYLARPSKAEILIFPEMCSILTALLKSHRARLNGRFHILISTLQALLKRLLAPIPRTTGPVVQLSSRHAHSFARVLTLLCDPPQQRHQRQNEQDSLIDQTRRVRAHVGSLIPVLLHSYCSLVLKTPPRQEIGEALAPGLWAVMGAMELNDADCMSVLGSAMNDSARSVLRTVVEQWRTNTRKSGR